MAVIINATTTTGLTTSADNSGVIQFQSNGANTVGISSTGYITIGGNQQIYGPAFFANKVGTSQTVTSGTTTKITFNTKQFDTANCFDNTTNYRFTPNVAGYYQINGTVYAKGTTIGTVIVLIYKNGSALVSGSFQATTAGGGNATSNVSGFIYLNGTTDYVELYGYVGGTGTITFPDDGTLALTSAFSGAMVRGA